MHSLNRDSEFTVIPFDEWPEPLRKYVLKALVYQGKANRQTVDVSISQRWVDSF